MPRSPLSGIALRKWRERQGKTQVESAEVLGIAYGTYWSYENGHRAGTTVPVKIPTPVDWALSAIDAKLKPWSQATAPASSAPPQTKTEGA